LRGEVDEAQEAHRREGELRIRSEREQRRLGDLLREAEEQKPKPEPAPTQTPKNDPEIQQLRAALAHLEADCLAAEASRDASEARASALEARLAASEKKAAVEKQRAARDKQRAQQQQHAGNSGGNPLRAPLPETRSRSNTQQRMQSLEASGAVEAARLEAAVSAGAEETAALRSALEGVEETGARWKELCGELEEENGEMAQEVERLGTQLSGREAEVASL
jgi:hypothetical protein